jgi:dinuclear metal center YbgI/SA1388 family protein
MQLKEIISVFEQAAPFALQETYDNSGLQTGNPGMEISAALICIDVTEEVIAEALRLKANLIISHHPLIFNGIKSLTGRNSIERILIRALKEDIAILSVHTNFDSISKGVSFKICEVLNLNNLQVLDPLKNALVKLVFFVPVEQAVYVREKVFEAGAGVIGNYDMCSFNTSGEGSFRANENTNPFVGDKGKLHLEKEIRVETILPESHIDLVVSALLKAHPYEEVAYDLYPLSNKYQSAGMGMTGELGEEMDEKEFLEYLKEKFNPGCIRHTNFLKRKIKKVAVCGGNGSFLLSKAIACGADVFVSGDFKYHQFFEAENKILIADIGHYESEQFTKELFYELLIKNYPKFALYLSAVNTNPINYL